MFPLPAGMQSASDTQLAKHQSTANFISYTPFFTSGLLERMEANLYSVISILSQTCSFPQTTVNSIGVGNCWKCGFRTRVSSVKYIIAVKFTHVYCKLTHVDVKFFSSHFVLENGKIASLLEPNQSELIVQPQFK